MAVSKAMCKTYTVHAVETRTVSDCFNNLWIAWVKIIAPKWQLLNKSLLNIGIPTYDIKKVWRLRRENIIEKATASVFVIPDYTVKGCGR